MEDLMVPLKANRNDTVRVEMMTQEERSRREVERKWKLMMK